MTCSRRAVLLGGTAALVTGCGGRPTATPSRSAAPTPSPSASSSPSPSASPSATPTLPATTPWQPSSGDLEPACKQAAARHVERAVATRQRAVQVVFAQYGGLLTDAASVLVVTRTWRLVAGQVRPGGATYDVRLTRRGRQWRVDAVHPSQPGAPRPLTPLARRVLASDRIGLPPAAAADVRAGTIHASVLTALLAVSRDHRLDVSVLRSGHPLDVFGTTRPSDHPLGKAFDTWRIDGRAVVDPRTSRQLVTEYMHAVADAGSDNVGGPVLLGSAPQWFSDRTHHDHVHAGFAS